MRGWLLWALVAGTACSEVEDKDLNQTPGSNNVVANNETDGSHPLPDAGNLADMADMADVDVTDMAPKSCVDTVEEGLAFAVDSQGPAGQFYVTAGFDGTTIWVAYNRPESETVTDEAIFVSRIACDGTVLLPPTRISPGGADARNYSPTLVSGSSFTYVVWVHQPNSGNAKQLLLKTFRANGSAMTDEPVDITPRLGEMALSETIWQPDIAATPDGVVVVAEVLGSETQVVVERVTPDGTVTETFLAFEEKGVDQNAPSVGTDHEGNIWVSWIRHRPADPANNIPEEPETPSYVSFGLDSPIPREGAPVTYPTVGEVMPLSVMTPSGPSDGMYLGYQATAAQRSSVVVRKLGDPLNLTLSVGSAGHVNFRPTLVHTPGGGAAAWYRYTSSPQKNSLVIQGFEDLGERLQAGPEVVVLASYDAIPPYGPGLVNLGDDLYFLAYSQGTSAPAARVMGKFVRAPQQ